MEGKWLDILKGLAPTLATAVGGPFAGTAVKHLSDALLGKKDGTEDELAKIIAAGDPDILFKIKEVETSFKLKMKELDIKDEDIATKDRDSARNREIQTKDKTPAKIAALVFFGFFGILISLMFFEIPKASMAPLQIMLGALATIVVQVAAYYFGSSAGSSKKNAIFEALINK